ncbi:hypothetical protein SDC9_160196 [bioreactor metagenome]|uniref:Uncharacterized protein n=1 Tax=bioreactor metagenome TaxID=1076179 RepID=A0A645FGX0_9ZZZZ
MGMGVNKTGKNITSLCIDDLGAGGGKILAQGNYAAGLHQNVQPGAPARVYNGTVFNKRLHDEASHERLKTAKQMSWQKKKRPHGYRIPQRRS